MNSSNLFGKDILPDALEQEETLDAKKRERDKLGSVNLRADEETKQSKIEINKRFGMPIYIPLISLISCFLLTSRKDKKMFYLNKYIYFFIGVLILVLAEIIVRYSGISWNHTIIYYLLPIGTAPLFYLALIRAFKYENLS